MKREGTLYASVERPPVMGGSVQSFDDKAALQVKGVKQTESIDPFKQPYTFQPLGGVAVIADSTLGGVSGTEEAEGRMEQRGECEPRFGSL